MLESSLAADPIATATMCLRIVDDLARAFGSLAYRHGVMLRDLMVDVLAWFHAKFPGDALPSGLRQRAGAYHTALVSTQSLLYQIHGSDVVFGLEDINPQATEAVTALRRRLLEADQPALAKVIMCSQVPMWEGLPEAQFTAYQTRLLDTVAASPL